MKKIICINKAALAAAFIILSLMFSVGCAKGPGDGSAVPSEEVSEVPGDGSAVPFRDENRDSNDTGDLTKPADTAKTEQENEGSQNRPPVLEKYDELLKVNPYVSGWLKVDDSKIDDPVVYTPGSQNYFLHRAIDGSEESKGTLFIAIDWQPEYNNTLIYGHNMKDGTAFGSLDRFADGSYGLTHNIIHFDTLYEEKDYKLFAAFYSRIPEEEIETEEDREQYDKEIEEEGMARKAEEGIEVDASELTLNDIDLSYDFGGEDIFRQDKDEDGGRFRYYYYTNLSDKDDFDYYVKNVNERALYDTGVTAQWGDEFITLSTCSYHVKNGRFVVVGVRHKDGR
ncbi:MAG: class B sortase [Lachnospiraceae bacterium]|nr:class B sortase [Lachnospiraceae bacterium]